MRNYINAVVEVVRKHSTIARLTIVVLCFGILLWNIHPREIIAAYAQAHGWYLFYAVLLMIPNVGLQAVKWNYIMNALNPKPSFRTVCVSLFGGFFLGASSPGRTGELARGVFVPGHSVVRVASLTVVDKGFNIIIIVLTGLLSLAFLLPGYLSLVPLVLEVVVLMAIFNIHRLEQHIGKILHRFTHSERVDNALAAFDTLSRKNVTIMLVISVIFYSVYASQFFLMLLCFTDISFEIAAKTIPVTYLIQVLLPISIGDFGIKEMVMVQLLGPFGIPAGASFSATFLNNVLTFLVPSLLGGVLMIFVRPSLGRAVPPSDSRTNSPSPRSSRQAAS